MDPGGAEGVARKIAAIAAEVAATHSELKTSLDQLGRPWGADVTGQTFAKTYVPDTDNALAAGQGVAGQLRALSSDLTTAIDAIDAHDHHGAAAIRRSTNGATPSAIAGPRYGAASGPVPTQSGPASATQAPSPVVSSKPSSATPQQTASSKPGAAQQQAGSSPTATPTSANGATPSSDPAATPAAATPAGEVGGGRAGSGTRTGPPGNRSGSAAAEGAPESASSPPAGPAARVSAPSPVGGGPGSALGRGPSAGESNSGTPVGRKAPRESAAARARAADRLRDDLGLELSGFDDDLDPDVLAEIAAAAERVLGAYPWLDVRGIAIAELPRNHWAQTVWDWEAGPTGPAVFVERIVLSTRAARNPDALAEAVSTATESGYLTRGSQQRPVYSTVIREFGHAMDAAGRFQARGTARRALVAAYVGAEPQTPDRSLARVVSGFRQWRDLLPGHGFPHGRFHPGTALAEAFTEVALHGDAASEPSTVLHRVLVEQAERIRTGAP
jgi:hypothetical protein